MAASKQIALLVVVAACAIPPEIEYVGGSDASADADADAGADATSPKSCRADGETLDTSSGHCYRLAAGPLDWGAAESDCVVWGGHLVAINDGTEQGFVANIVNTQVVDGGVWIGLNNMQAPPTYAWTTGEPLTFNNWGTAPTGKPCVFFYSLKITNHWDDFLCGVQAPYLCER